ncbi:hypothetical protein TIFTF001_006850 [Ficus carica]|uniref:Uncharacterized protein n=1 Tax=Ficus carica TaxID=3494 RepID=A0AA88AC62_FICCA|nr:hypothetical protein TIFTF001_006850 [Ficus carica]
MLESTQQVTIVRWGWLVGDTSHWSHLPKLVSNRHVIIGRRQCWSPQSFTRCAAPIGHQSAPAVRVNGRPLVIVGTGLLSPLVPDARVTHWMTIGRPSQLATTYHRL